MYIEGSETSWPAQCPPRDSRFEFTIKHNGDDHLVSWVWGDARAFGTAAYWVAQCLISFGQTYIPTFSIGANLFEETIACMLGGYGVSGEMTLAAFSALREAGLVSFEDTICASEVEAVLTKPIVVGERVMRYRFPRQRAVRISSAINYFKNNPVRPLDPLPLREWLLRIKGIGMKKS